MLDLHIRVTDKEAERLKEALDKDGKDKALWHKINQAVGWAIMEKEEAQKPLPF